MEEKNVFSTKIILFDASHVFSEKKGNSSMMEIASS